MMKITLEERLPNLINGSINKISSEMDCKVKDNEKDIHISGQFVITREIRTENRTTEIRDCIPLDINISKRRLIKKTAEVFIFLEGFRVDFEGDFTVFIVEVELTNVTDPTSSKLSDELVFQS